jgi:hypothetical protein
MTNIEILVSFGSFDGLIASSLHLLKDIFVIQLARLVPTKINFSKTQELHK